jgi:hypothetical protein
LNVTVTGSTPLASVMLALVPAKLVGSGREAADADVPARFAP